MTLAMSARRVAPETVAAMRRFVEETPLPFAEIGRRCGVSGGTVWRYARDEGWSRPAAARPSMRAHWRDVALPASEPGFFAAAEASPEERRRAAIGELWRLAETQIRHLRAAARAEPRELRTLVEVLERLTRLEEEALRREEGRAAATPAAADDDGPSTFAEIDQMIEEIARRFESFKDGEYAVVGQSGSGCDGGANEFPDPAAEEESAARKRETLPEAGPWAAAAADP